MGDCPEPASGMRDEGDAGAFGWGDLPATAQKVDLAVGVDAAFQVEGQMQVQKG